MSVQKVKIVLQHKKKKIKKIQILVTRAWCLKHLEKQALKYSDGVRAKNK